MSEYKRITLKIAGYSFSVNTDEDEEKLISLCNEITEQIRNYKSKQPYISSTLCACITALGYADELDNLKQIHSDNSKADEFEKTIRMLKQEKMNLEKENQLLKYKLLQFEKR